MIKQIYVITFSIIILLLGMGVLQATLCNISYTLKDATETVIVHQQFPVMENKQITSRDYNMVKWNSDIKLYNAQLELYNNKAIQIKPTYPVMTYITTTKTYQVQKMNIKVTYYIDWVNWRIGSRTTYTPVYIVQDVEKQQIKKDYVFDEDTGLFNHLEDC